MAARVRRTGVLFTALRGTRPLRGSLLGLVYGLTAFGISLSWLRLFGTLGWFALTLLAALSVALFGLGYPLVRRPSIRCSRRLGPPPCGP